MKNNLLIRALSGALLVAVLVCGVWFSEYTRFIILYLLSFCTLYELLKLMRGPMGVPVMVKYCLVAAIVIFVAQLAGFVYTVETIVLFGLVRGIWELYRKQSRPLEAFAYEVLALLYCVAPILLLAHYPREIIIMIFVLVWSNDVMAYLVGMSIGRNKIFPRLSPKKSWEGFIGGVVSAMIVGGLLGNYWLQETPWMWVILGGVVAVSGFFGDLFESMIKRSVHLKDSGHLIPGHGGLLDRFDALLFAVPAFYLVREALQYFFS